VSASSSPLAILEARVATFLIIRISRVNSAAAVGLRKAAPFLAARPVDLEMGASVWISNHKYFASIVSVI
jgi:hypothetical protein